MFSSLFGKKNKDAPRKLESAHDLQQGDIVVFRDTLSVPEALRGQSVEVAKVSAYEYESGFEPEFALKTTSGETYFLSSSDEDGEVTFSISRRIQRATVEKIFNLDDFGEILEEGYSEISSLESTPEEYKEWVADHYHEEEDCLRCYFHNRDRRGDTPAQYSYGEANGEELNYYECINNNGDLGFSIEVYNSGDTEVSLFKRFDQTVIEDMFPNEQ